MCTKTSEKRTTCKYFINKQLNIMTVAKYLVNARTIAYESAKNAIWFEVILLKREILQRSDIFQNINDKTYRLSQLNLS